MNKTLVLSARDGLFCKDGRGWKHSATGRSNSYEWPFPSTMLGALCTSWGRHVEAKEKRLLTPEEWLEIKQNLSLQLMLPLRKSHNEDWSSQHLMWPVPEDALHLAESDFVYRLNPTPPAASVGSLGRKTQDEKTEDALAQLWLPRVEDKSKPVNAPAWWTHQEFIKWLQGKDVKKLDTSAQKGRSMERRLQVHVSINKETRTTLHSSLFSTDILETLNFTEQDGYQEWGLAIDCQLPNQTHIQGFSKNHMFLGGKRRFLRPEEAPKNLFSCPQDLSKAAKETKSKGLRLITVTPAHFKDGWKPDFLKVKDGRFQGELHGLSLVLRAACCPRPIHVSGWDMARGCPKPTKRLVKPGSVYFFEKADNTTFTSQDIETLWLAGWGQDQDEGYGTFVAGLWSPQHDS